MDETRDPQPWDLKLRTRDLRPETQIIGGTWDPRPGTLKTGHETKTWYTYFTWDLRPEIQDTETGVWDTYDR